MNAEEASSDVRLEFILNRLDGLLLSVVSVLSIIYGVINTSIHRSLILVYFIPIVILYFIPIWIGYIRGAIILDRRVERLEERIRGWIYLFGGTVGYLSHFIVIILLERVILPTPNIFVKLFLFTLVVVLTLGFTYLLFLKRKFPARKLHKTMYRHLALHSPPYSTDKIINISNRNALLLGVWLYSFTLFIARIRKTILSGVLISLLLFIVLVALIYGERSVRCYVRSAITDEDP